MEQTAGNMFGTLRQDAGSEEATFVNRTYSFLEKEDEAIKTRASCDRCRAKKMRCSGEKTGCGRCVAASSSCIYSPIVEDGRSKRRKQNVTKASLSAEPQIKPIQELPQTEAAPKDNAESGTLTLQTVRDASDFADIPDIVMSTESGDLPEDLMNLDGFEAEIDAALSQAVQESRRTPAPLLEPELSQPESSKHRSSSRRRRSRSSPLECRCASRSMALKDDMAWSNPNATFLSVLATQKEYITRFNPLVTCDTCMTKPPNLYQTLITFEELVQYSRNVVQACIKRRPQADGKPWQDTTERNLPIPIGEYRIDSNREWQCVVEALMVHQVKRLARQSYSMRMPATVNLKGSELHKLIKADKALRDMMKMLESND